MTVWQRSALPDEACNQIDPPKQASISFPINTMARIAVLVSNPCTGDARVIKMARAAVEAGHEVQVFATAGANAAPFEELRGVTFHRLEWRPTALLSDRVPKFISRVLGKRVMNWSIKQVVPFFKYRLFTRLFAPHVAAIAPDIVHAHDLICLPAGQAAAQACGAKLVYDAHELETHRNPPLPFLQKRFVGHVELKYARRADAVITVGELVCRELSAHIRRDDVNVLYNSPPLDPCPRHIRDDLMIRDDVPLIIYVGKVTEGRGVGEILELMPKMPGVMFATVGPVDTMSRARLEEKSDRMGVSARFRILPPVPFEQVVTYIAGADLGVISVEPITLSYRYCMPNKLFELSFANIPIISNKLDEIEMFLAKFGNGQITDFEDKASLAYLMFRMLNEKERYVMDATAFEKLRLEYSWDSQQRRLLTIYDKLLPTL